MKMKLIEKTVILNTIRFKNYFKVAFILLLNVYCNSLIAETTVFSLNNKGIGPHSVNVGTTTRFSETVFRFSSVDINEPGSTGIPSIATAQPTNFVEEVATGSKTITATTLAGSKMASAAAATYCASKGQNVSDEYIERVVLNTIDNTSGSNSGYADFTGLSTSLYAGIAYSISIYPTWTGTVYDEGYAVWIDYNHDQVFDANELVFSSDPSTSKSVSGTFTVPSGVLAGTTRMRVAMSYNKIPVDPCEDPSYGEVEDYSINLINNSSDPVQDGTEAELWKEDFTLANGTTVDKGETRWSVSGSPSGTFSVQDNRFKASFSSTSTEGVWTSGVIDISSKSNVTFSIDLVSETASSSDPFEDTDYINVYYILDNGAETLVFENNSGLNGSTTGTETQTVVSPSINGSALQIVVRVKNSHSTERYYFDNVIVSGTHAASSLNPTVQMSGALSCIADNVTLIGNSNVAGATYSWTGPNNFTANTQSTTVTAVGGYILKVTDSYGASATALAIVVMDDEPPGAFAEITSELSCTSSSATLSGSSPSGNVTYSWTGPGNYSSASQITTVYTMGEYTLTVTRVKNGCTSEAKVNVGAAGSGPVQTIWSEDFTLGNGVTSDGEPTSWTTSTAGSGTFSVQDNEFKVSFNSAAEGVWSSEAIDISTKTNVTVSVDLRSSTASTSDYLEDSDYINVYYKLDGGPETLIFGDVAGLNSINNSTASLTVTSNPLTAGTLQVVIRASNSHSTELYYFDNVIVKGQDLPVGVITTSVSGIVTCPNPNVQLTASVSDPAATYYWVDPDNVKIESQNPIVNKGGEYIVVVGSGGCQGRKMVQVGGGTDAPNVEISGGHLVNGSSDQVVLNPISTNDNLTYSWTGPNGFKSTLKAPSVSEKGAYSLTVMDNLTQCPNTISYEVRAGELVWSEDFNDLADGVVVDNGATAWSVDISKIHTVDLSYYSSENGIPYYFETRSNRLAAKSTLGEVVWTSQVIDISGIEEPYVRYKLTGVGSLNDTNDCGQDCFDYDYIKTYYKLNGGPKTPFTNKGSIPGKVALSSPTISSDLPQGNTLEIVIEAYNTGNSEIFYFDDFQVLSLSDECELVTVSGGNLLTCDTDTITLKASPDIPELLYNWYGPSGFITQGTQIPVSKGGQYMLIVEGSNVCDESDTIKLEITENKIPPNVYLDSTGKITCKIRNPIITAGSDITNASYLWSGPNNFQSDTSSISVSIPGEYYLQVTNEDNGCFTKDTIDILSDTTAPVLSVLTKGILNCINNKVVISATSIPSMVEYSWNGPDGRNYSSAHVEVSVAGTYSLTVLDTNNGCSKGSSIIVPIDTVKPGASASSNNLDCSNYFSTLKANSPTQPVDYEWRGPNNYYSTQQEPVTTKAGSYDLKVFNPINGCVSFANTKVEDNSGTGPTNVSATVSGKLNCSVTSVNLTGSSASAGMEYAWNGPNGFVANGQVTSVSEPGDYRLTVTNPQTNCSSTTNVKVEKDTLLTGVPIASVSNILTCKNTVAKLSAFTIASGDTYSWTGPDSFSSDSQKVSVDKPGDYYLKLTNSSTGCTLFDTVTVEQDITKPIIRASVSGSVDCNFTPVNLNVKVANNQLFVKWTDSRGIIISHDPSFSTFLDDAYTAEVMDPENGCVSTAQVIVNYVCP